MQLLRVMLGGMLRKDVWHANRAVIAQNAITNHNVNTLVQVMDKLHQVIVGRDRPPDDVLTAIEAQFRGARQDELVTLLAEASTDVDYETVQPAVADYLARELVLKAVTWVGGRIDGDKFDVSVPLEMLQQAAEIASGVDLDVEDVALAAPPSLDNERQGITTVGLGPEMNRHLGGGVANGEMLIWLAPPGVGKTSLLINNAVEMAQDGEHVLHISLEINAAKCRQRVDQKLTGLTREERLGNPKAVVAARRAMSGKVYIKDWSSRDVKVEDIRSLVLNMRAQGMTVTAISVDYLELMAPTKNNRHGERFNYSATARGLRQLGNELGVKILTAWQVNRAGSDKHVIGKTDVSECWDVVKHADIILGLNQNEEELRNHTLRVNIIKQRESTARPIEYYYSNLDRMVIYHAGEGDADEFPEAVGARDRSGLRQHGCGAETPT